MNTDLVTIEVSNGIADVRLNRAEKYNALSHDMFDAIIAAGQSLANASDVSAVVLSGNGRGFCAGLDMANFASMSDGSRQSHADTSSLLATDGQIENRAQRPALVWKRLPMPVIASLHGVVFGSKVYQRPFWILRCKTSSKGRWSKVHVVNTNRR